MLFQKAPSVVFVGSVPNIHTCPACTCVSFMVFHLVTNIQTCLACICESLTVFHVVTMWSPTPTPAQPAPVRHPQCSTHTSGLHFARGRVCQALTYTNMFHRKLLSFLSICNTDEAYCFSYLGLGRYVACEFHFRR